MSNILSVFNPPPPRELPGKPCLSCTAVQSLVCIGGGTYLSSTLPFKDSKTGRIDFNKNPVWWQKSIRGLGILLVGLGAYRAGEIAQTYLRDRFE
ncbi:uncharacterized protein PRCAT00002904001 [Priceomyces carsonii]|uniref:uncharacterized protein n=1 Tax=Priceomyces carsonii TaxID=28549 RepID=UPI002ED82D4D|nr:unnamed protein product [Priceomyces carsonii]